MPAGGSQLSSTIMFPKHVSRQDLHHHTCSLECERGHSPAEPTSFSSACCGGDDEAWSKTRFKCRPTKPSKSKGGQVPGSMDSPIETAVCRKGLRPFEITVDGNGNLKVVNRGRSAREYFGEDRRIILVGVVDENQDTLKEGDGGWG